jgi:hypothetical protein
MILIAGDFSQCELSQKIEDKFLLRIKAIVNKYKNTSKDWNFEAIMSDKTNSSALFAVEQSQAIALMADLSDLFSKRPIICT